VFLPLRGSEMQNGMPSTVKFSARVLPLAVYTVFRSRATWWNRTRKSLVRVGVFGALSRVSVGAETRGT